MHVSSFPITPDFSGTDKNPAIQLFGRRFFADQTPSELLVELLLVLNSPKSIGSVGDAQFEHGPFPSFPQLKAWPEGAGLTYKPKMRLNLKLFAFLGSSKLETRHTSHRQQYDELLRVMRRNISVTNVVTTDDVLRGLENLYLGFQGAGQSRTWCAQSFLPVSSGLIAGESMWQNTKATKEGVTGWRGALAFFDHNQRIFLARGGELLYLQMCNALRQANQRIHKWISDNQLALNEEEREPDRLYKRMTDALSDVTEQSPLGIKEIAEWIERLDMATAAHTDRGRAECGWCPEESWSEGYLFTVEVNRVCRATIDPVERIELLTTGCALQVLRSLCAQSSRYDSVIDPERKSQGGTHGFAWLACGPEGGADPIRRLSERNLVAVQNMIYSAIRNEKIQDKLRMYEPNEEKQESLCQEADRRYGHKLFVSLGKKIGLIVPQRGPGARFTLNDRLLRYFVLALIRPGERATLESFKTALYKHYGLALDGPQLKAACRWSCLPSLDDTLSVPAKWFEEMLRAAGFLIQLSDACSMVHNPFGDTAFLGSKQGAISEGVHP